MRGGGAWSHLAHSAGEGARGGGQRAPWQSLFLTGGAQGIGRECALAYAREGATVVIADVSHDDATRTVDELGEQVIAIDCDVGDGNSVRKAIDETLRRCGKLDVVHNNVGIHSPSKPLQETSEEEWDRLVRVNLKSVYLTTAAVFEALRATKGVILNTASMVGLIGQANHAAFVATKGGMIALTKTMALDFAPYGIRVNEICPAGVWTPLQRQWVAEQPDPAAMERYLDELHPLAPCPEGDVVADAAVFLVSERARFITGCILPVSGGAELGYRR